MRRLPASESKPLKRPGLLLIAAGFLAFILLLLGATAPAYGVLYYFGLTVGFCVFAIFSGVSLARGNSALLPLTILFTGFFLSIMLGLGLLLYLFLPLDNVWAFFNVSALVMIFLLLLLVYLELSSPPVYQMLADQQSRQGRSPTDLQLGRRFFIQQARSGIISGLLIILVTAVPVLLAKFAR